MADKGKKIIRKRALKPGTLLKSCYEIEGVLGAGGFGITYVGCELENHRKVAIKEYFPMDLAFREYTDSSWNVTVFEGENEEYDRGLQRFLREAKILKDFQYLDGIVAVMDCFEENRTAYIVMEYIEGITLKQYVNDNGCLSFQELLELLEPLMKALIQIHRQGLIHRDISPDNLLIGLDNKARLIDFGAANLIGDRYQKSTTVVLKKGYAPPEQYLTEGKQGPWTDVYALSATMYMALTGQAPVDSVERLQGKEVSAMTQNDMETWQITAIQTGMELKVSRRYKNVEELLHALTTPLQKEDEKTICPQPASKEEIRRIRRLNTEKKNFVMAGMILILTVVLIGVAQRGTLLKNQDNDNGKNVETEENEADEPEVSKLYTIPKVTGMGEEEAKQMIAASNANLQISVIEAYSEDVDAGLVASQSVAADTQYSIGAVTEIVLTVSKGKEEQTTENSTENSTSSEGAVSTKNSFENKTGSTEKRTTDSDFNIIEDDSYDTFNLGD
jgi:serine/threonine protein kinase